MKKKEEEEKEEEEEKGGGDGGGGEEEEVLVVPVDCWWSTSSIVQTSQREDFDGYRTLPRTLERLFLGIRTLAELTRSMSRTIWLNQFLHAYTFVYITVHADFILKRESKKLEMRTNRTNKKYTKYKNAICA
ncbi:hypothetical protein V1478_010975 [Vespula squamosa]|uniref:Uncharacterized protein n=1 Tax=Vespula squamosa TaxID=30214 RepID=A0ABD2AFX3_VESSQ